MNTLREVAEAVYRQTAESPGVQSSGDVEAGDTELSIPLEGGSTVSLVQNAVEGSLILTVFASHASHSAKAVEELREKLLRETYDSRFTRGYVGSLRPDGSESLGLALRNPPASPEQAEADLTRLSRALNAFADGTELSETSATEATPAEADPILNSWMRI